MMTNTTVLPFLIDDIIQRTTYDPIKLAHHNYIK